MTIFEHRTIGLLEEIRDLLAKLTSEPPKTTPKTAPETAPVIALETPESSETTPEPEGKL